MYKITTLFIGFLWISFGLNAQNTGQLYNEGSLYVSPQTLMTATSDFINAESGNYNNDGEVLLKADFKNNGLAGFTQEGGITRFEGDELQMIEGGIPTDYYNIYLKNQTPVYAFGLSGDMEVYGEVNFDQGVINNKTHPGYIVFKSNADHFNTSDQSYVEGPVDKEGAESFTYPIGKKGYYRPAKTVLQSGEPLHSTGEFIFENSDEVYTHTLKEGVISLIDDQQYWTIDKANDTDQDVFVTLTWRDVTTPDQILNAVNSNEYKLVVVHWDRENQMWVNEGGTVDPDRKSVTSGAVSGFGVFTFGLVKRDNLEPCDVVIYNAVTPNGDGVNDYFRIQNEGDCARNFQVKIFNRWGVQVYETSNYGQGDDVFRGFSKGRTTVDSKKQLPTGTYFYILQYQYDSGNNLKTHQKAGYLYLSGNSSN